MAESQLFGIVPAKGSHRILLVVLILTLLGLYWITTRPNIQSMPVPETLKTLPKFQEERVSQREFNCTPISQSVNQSNPFQQERFWYDLVVNQKKNVLNQLPSHILQSHGCFWLTQTQIFNEGSSDRQVESLSEIMQSQLEEVLDDADCSDRLTLNCGHYTDCGFGCQLHHRAFCALVSFTLGIPLIHDLSIWPFKSSWESMFKRLGSGCEKNNKTIDMKFYPKAVPSLRFPKLCSNNSCVTDLKVQLNLTQDLMITKELLDLVKATTHQDPFLWYIGQFIQYSFRFNDQMQDEFRQYEQNFTFDASRPVFGLKSSGNEYVLVYIRVQARRTDKTTEAKKSFHATDEYVHIFEVFFKILENHQNPKTVFIASDDHTVLADIRKSYTLPSWKVLGFDSNITMANQRQRNSDLGLISIVRDLYFLAKCNFVICGLSSNVCRMILEIMATQFPNCNSKLYSLDGSYTYPMWGLDLTLKLVPV